MNEESPALRKRWWNATRKEALIFYLLISPWLLGFLVFVLGPTPR